MSDNFTDLYFKTRMFMENRKKISEMVAVIFLREEGEI